MFTRETLVAELPRLMTAALPPIEVIEFDHQDFDSAASEQLIWAFRGAKHDFTSGLLFWIKTLQAQEGEGENPYFVSYASAGLCEPISELELARLVVEYSRSLQKPLPLYLTRFDGFRSGLRMYAEWNDVAAVAETAETYIAFHWSTTA